MIFRVFAFFILTGLGFSVVACNSVNTTFEDASGATITSGSNGGGGGGTTYTCGDLDLYTTESLCESGSYDAFCDGSWTTFPDGSLSFCYAPREGWESCQFTPGKWVVTTNTTAEVTDTNQCTVRSTILGCNSTICQCDDSLIAGIETIDLTGLGTVPGPISETIVFPVDADSRVRTIPASVEITECVYGSSQNSFMFGNDHTIADCEAISVTVADAEVKGQAVYLEIDADGNALTSDPEDVVVCKVPLSDSDYQAEYSQLVNGGCPVGWSKAAKFMGTGHYGVLASHSESCLAGVYSVDSDGDGDFEMENGVSTYNGECWFVTGGGTYTQQLETFTETPYTSVSACVMDNLYCDISGLQLGVDPEAIVRTPNNVAYEFNYEWDGATWDSDASGAGVYVRNNLTHVLCY